MTEPASENGHSVEAGSVKAATVVTNGSPAGPELPTTPEKRPRKRGPNYGFLHSKPLPLLAHPLPAFHPTNPISLLRLAYTYIAHLLYPPSSHPVEQYIGYFSPETRSVHITDQKHVRALWEMGFFGKGTLSRSEPTWLDREKARVKVKRSGGGGTAEEATNARREDRRLKKMERARAEAEKIERQRLIEEGKLDPTVIESGNAEDSPTLPSEPSTPASKAPERVTILSQDTTPSSNTGSPETKSENDLQIDNQEHLQLTLEEAFFLSYGLGVLIIKIPNGTASNSIQSLLPLFTSHSFFPPRQSIPQILPDDPFLLSYATYHHFRSLGWVVRPGIKFSVDYLLYYRGPVFSHAEFAVLIMPSYTDVYWSSEQGKLRRRIKEDESKDWWWLHCINRVQSQVLKSLVLVYVDIPATIPLKSDGNGEVDIGTLLRSYKIREFIIKRWVANRSRD